MTDPDDFDDYDDVYSNSTPCPCGEAVTFTRECWECGGDGEGEGYDDDPLWYLPGEYDPCHMCQGAGFLHWCKKCGRDITGRMRAAHERAKREAEAIAKERAERQGDLPL